MARPERGHSRVFGPAGGWPHWGRNVPTVAAAEQAGLAAVTETAVPVVVHHCTVLNILAGETDRYYDLQLVGQK